MRSTYDDTHLLVAYVPGSRVPLRHRAFSRAALGDGGRAREGSIGAGLTYVGPRPLPYGQRSEELFTPDLSASLNWSPYELGFSVSNLFDTRYRLGEYNYASDLHTEPQPTLVPMRHFTAGAPRAIYATFGINFGGS